MIISLLSSSQKITLFFSSSLMNIMLSSGQMIMSMFSFNQMITQNFRDAFITKLIKISAFIFSSTANVRRLSSWSIFTN